MVCVWVSCKYGSWTNLNQIKNHKEYGTVSCTQLFIVVVQDACMFEWASFALAQHNMMKRFYNTKHIVAHRHNTLISGSIETNPQDKTNQDQNNTQCNKSTRRAIRRFELVRLWAVVITALSYLPLHTKIACELTLNAQVKRLFTFNCNSTVGWTAAEMIVAIYRTFIGTMRLTWIFIFGLEHDSIGVFVEKCYIPYEYIIGRFEMCNKMILLDLGKRKFSLVLHQKWLGGGIKRMMQIQFFCKPKLQ